MVGREKKKLIAVVLYPGMTALDLVGTMETLIGLNMGSAYRVVSVGEHIDPIQTDTSLKVVPNRAFWEVPAPFGLIVPGGGDTAVKTVDDETLRTYVVTASETAELVASIGTGSLILASAGLMNGRSATTHWEYADQLQKFGVRYVRQRWVEDGKFITAAGVTAAIDMCLYLMSKLTSVPAAKRVQLAIEYDPQPPLGRIDWDQVVPDSIPASPADQVAEESIPIDQLSEESVAREQQ